MSKQDRAYTRTASDLERKYNFGQSFAEVYGLVSDAQRAAETARKAVDELDNALSPEELFNRLTNYGEVQGIYRENDEIYINASYIKSGRIAAQFIDAENLHVNAANIDGTITAGAVQGNAVALVNGYGSLSGSISLSDASTGLYAVDINSFAAMRMQAQSGDMWLEASGISQPFLWLRVTQDTPILECRGDFRPTADSYTPSGTYSLGSPSYAWASVWAMEGTIQTSDRNQKNSIADIPEKYADLFMNLRPRLYKYNNGTSDRYHVGYIAQEVEEAMTAAGVTAQEFAGLVIDTDEEGNQVYMLRYDEFMALHTMMIQKIIKER